MSSGRRVRDIDERKVVVVEERSEVEEVVVTDIVRWEEDSRVVVVV